MRRRRKRKSNLKRKLFKLFIIAFITFITSVKLTTDGTFCLFNDSKTSNMSVKAAIAEDIIKSFTLSPSSDNPTSIILQKASGINYNTTVYFSIEGDASKFVKHINPIQLTSNDPVSVDITIGIELKQFLQLIYNKDKEIKGIVKMKYLNEFIDEEKEVSFTKEYLLGQFLSGIKLDKSKLLESKNSNETSLTEDQVKIIDFIAPGLRTYMQKLQSENDELTNKLNLINSELKNQNTQLEDLTKKKKELEDKINKQNKDATNTQPLPQDLDNEPDDKPSEGSDNLLNQQEEKQQPTIDNSQQPNEEVSVPVNDEKSEISDKESENGSTLSETEQLSDNSSNMDSQSSIQDLDKKLDDETVDKLAIDK